MARVWQVCPGAAASEPQWVTVDWEPHALFSALDCKSRVLAALLLLRVRLYLGFL